MGTLILQDGTVIKGKSFGAVGGYCGEVVFNTSMTGYQEILTDLSYAKQIVIMTYPEIGNYGINDFDFEADNPALVGLIVKNNCLKENHYKSRESLTNYLRMNNIIALDSIDTRSLVEKIREYGTMNGFITSNDVDNEFIKEKLEELQKFSIKEDVINEVSTKNRYIYNPQGKINITIPKNTDSAKVLRLKGLGLPKKDGSLGNLNVKIKINIPKEISKEALDLYEKLSKINS